MVYWLGFFSLTHTDHNCIHWLQLHVVKCKVRLYFIVWNANLVVNGSRESLILMPLSENGVPP